MKHLINDLYLDTNKYNYILKRRYLKRNGKNVGKEEFEILGYYGSNLKMLLNAIVDIYCLENINNMEFKEMISFINEILELKKELIK